MKKTTKHENNKEYGISINIKTGKVSYNYSLWLEDHSTITFYVDRKIELQEEAENKIMKLENQIKTIKEQLEKDLFEQDKKIEKAKNKDEHTLEIFYNELNDYVKKHNEMIKTCSFAKNWKEAEEVQK